MPAPHSFEFALLRVVPRVERGEFINAGLILFCLAKKTLLCRLHTDENRLQALWPQLDQEELARHLAVFPAICQGLENAGPISRLTQRERFHWLTAPRSTVIQISPVHSGLCHDPETALNELFYSLVVP